MAATERPPLALKNFRALFVWHYTDVRSRRSPEQEDAEKYLIGNIVFKRWMLLPAAILVQLCVGTFLSWSVYNVPIEKYTGAPKGAASVTFYTVMGVFGLSSAVFGPVVERRGPRMMLMLSSTFFFVGNMLAALGVYLHILAIVYVGFGVVGGMGLGVAYLTPISPLQKFYPDYRGLVSAIAVSGFGVGAIVASKTQAALVSALSPPWSFIIHGIIFYVLQFSCSFILRAPPTGYTIAAPAAVPATTTPVHSVPVSQNGKDESKNSSDEGKTCAGKDASDDASVHDGAAVVVETGDEPRTQDEYLHEPEIRWTLLECLQSFEYRLVYLTFLLSNIPNLLASARLADMCQRQFHTSYELASTIVAVTAVFNLSGRLIFGATSDKLGRKNCYLFMLAVQAVIMGFTPMFFSHGYFWAFAVTQWIVGMMSGASFALIAAFLTDLFTTRNLGGLFGVIMTAAPSFVGVVFGLTFNAIYKQQAAIHGEDASNIYNINFYWMTATQVVGLFLCSLIPRDLHERLHPKVPGQIFGFRVFGRLMRLQYVPERTEKEEWKAYLKTLPENQGYRGSA
eukprot:comp22661_c0_seq1/m.34968 comp22661_c0_seq1/g.34968  ORF comp22661_c0_seq1/g.34968 comp22661_c0_seq1/m.34968 type:complete len:567 (-) comp22661_c0_seq1:439-2139(-)